MMWRWSSNSAGNTMLDSKVATKQQLILVRGQWNRALYCVHQSMFISVCFCINICSVLFLPSNFYYTSIISIRTKSGRIHLNKTNFAAIIEKTREMLFFFQDTTVWQTTEFQWFRQSQSQNTRYSTSSNRYNIYREKFPKNVFIFYRFFFLVSPFSPPRLNCTVNIKTENVQTKNILTKHPVSRSQFFFFIFLRFLFFSFLCVFSVIERTALNTNLIDGTEMGEKLTSFFLTCVRHLIESNRV